MGVFDKGLNEYTGIGRLVLSKGSVDLKEGLLGVSGSVNGLIISTTTLYTISAGFDWLITGILLEFTSAVSISGTLKGSIGTNATSYDNIVPVTTYTGFNDAAKLYKLNLEGAYRKAFSGDVVTFKLTQPFTGTTADFQAYFLGMAV